MTELPQSEPLIRDKADGLPPLAWLVLALFFAGLYAVYFLPALANNALLAPGDGEIYYLPFFQLSITELWNDLLLSGYPVVSDIQALTFYPFRWFSPTFNFLVVSAYIIAALGTFGLSLSLTGSRIGALCAALIVSGSGFMMGHLGHLSIIHSAAWVPWILWAIATLRSVPRWTPVGLGSIATALTVYGGHPQVAVMGMLLAGAYGLSEALTHFYQRGGREGLRMVVRIFLLFLLGLLISSPALLGLISSASAGVRSAWTIADFNSFSHDFATLRMLAFPNAYGAQAAGPYGAYLGPYNLTELAMYAGIAPGMLAIAALADCRVRRKALFWAVAGGVALVLALGTSTFFGGLVFKLPILGQFRAQARFGLLFIICIGVLSAYGLSSILRDSLSVRRKVITVFLSVMLVLGAIASVAMAPPQALAAADSSWFLQPAFLVPVLMMMASLALFALAVYQPSHAVVLSLVGLIVIDLASFGWFHDWRYVSPHVRLAEGTLSQLGQTGMTNGKGRVLTLGADQWPAGPLRPNSNISYDVPLAVGYGPLLSARYAVITGADTTGGIPRIPPDAPLMDVLAIRWVAGSYEDTSPLLFGSGCGTHNNVSNVRAAIPTGVEVRSVRVVSHSSCSQELENGRAIADVIVQDASGTVRQVSPLESGVHTAEWAYDRADVKASIAHARPHVSESFDAGGFRGLWFDGIWAVAAEGISGGAIVLSARNTGGAPVKVKTIEVQDSASGKWIPLAFGPGLGGGNELLAPVTEIAGLPPVRERIGYRGMAWTVCNSRVLTLAEMAVVLRSKESVPNAATYDPFGTVLLEAPLPGAGLSCKGPMTTSVIAKRPGYWKLKTVTDSPGVLVVSTSFNKGWNVTINGEAAEFVPAYGVVVGVPVPAGVSEVELSFFPRNLLITIIIAGLALALALGMGLVSGISTFIARIKPLGKV